MDIMPPSHTIKIHDLAKGKLETVSLPEDRYILHSGENPGIELPFFCRNGPCTTCAVRVKSGELELCPELPKKGYALLSALLT